MLELRSAFRDAEAIDSRAMLETNLRLPMGSICLHGQYLVLVHKACLDHLTVDGVLFLLTRVSLLADMLEEGEGTDRF
jgi:hypothetical protein